ncbi:hypothetical protein, partial [Nostoc sp. 'Peltigera membranacea cyanobiont' 232]|uniref:hypothetical protein n=1 Tax=Nostoc sp. 'Peltigera membranacea cyanobiont' 232 TaxID=2014531 RepID=UPI000B9F367F
LCPSAPLHFKLVRNAGKGFPPTSRLGWELTVVFLYMKYKVKGFEAGDRNFLSVILSPTFCTHLKTKLLYG